MSLSKFASSFDASKRGTKKKPKFGGKGRGSFFLDLIYRARNALLLLLMSRLGNSLGKQAQIGESHGNCQLGGSDVSGGGRGKK